MTETEIAYFAGLFDGEGCITCGRNAGNPYPVATVTSQNKEVIEEMVEKFGGRIAVYEQAMNNRVQYRWSLNGIKLKPFLETIQPYSKIKKLHIKLGLAIVSTLAVKGQHIPPKDLLLREELWQLLSSINGKKRRVGGE